ncbi:MAG: TIGR04283 family arsenosugar biosynthesis glycosyltransferase [Aquabacterium sp.]
MAPSLSIIVPVRDEAEVIGPALLRLAPLRALGAEVIVVDGGSRDDTVDRCTAAADLVLQAPAGRARQMNAGAARARGRQLLFLHADTRLPLDAAAVLAQALAPGPAPGGHLWGRFDVRIEGRSRWLPMVAALMNRRSRWTGIATGDQALFMRRDVFQAVGGFPDQALMEDIELSRRLKRLGPPACRREQVITSGRRWDSRGAWRTILLMWRLRWLYWIGVSPERLARAYR